MLTQERYNFIEIAELTGQHVNSAYSLAKRHSKPVHMIKVKGSKVIMMSRDWVEMYIQYIHARTRLQGDA